MQIYKTKPLFQKVLKPIADVFVKFKVHPTYINFAALLVSIIAGVLIYYSSFNLALLLWIPILAFTRIAFNALDGMVARQMKVKNQKFGEVLNEMVDRFSDMAFFLGVAFAIYVNTTLALITFIFVLMVSYTGIVGKSAGGSRQYSAVMGKADRMFWLSVACVAIVIFGNSQIMNWFLWFVLVLSVITIAQRFILIKKELYVRRRN